MNSFTNNWSLICLSLIVNIVSLWYWGIDEYLRKFLLLITILTYTWATIHDFNTCIAQNSLHKTGKFVITAFPSSNIMTPQPSYDSKLNFPQGANFKPFRFTMTPRIKKPKQVRSSWKAGHAAHHDKSLSW